MLLLDVCDINVHLNIINDFVCILVHHSHTFLHVYTALCQVQYEVSQSDLSFCH